MKKSPSSQSRPAPRLSPQESVRRPPSFSKLVPGFLAGMLFIGGIFTLHYQRRKQEYLAPLTTPCAPDQQKTLSQVDAFILERRDLIKEWYHASCQVMYDGRCDPIPEPVFDSYRDSSIDRYCSSIQSLSANGPVMPDLRGVDLSPLIDKSSITLMPLLFSEHAFYGDVCSIINTDLHERIHAITGVLHSESLEPGEFDFARDAGRAAEYVCVDSLLPPDPNLNTLERHQRVLKEMMRRLNLKTENLSLSRSASMRKSH